MATVGEVNISKILNSFQMGYDKRVRPNYGGKFYVYMLEKVLFKLLINSFASYVRWVSRCWNTNLKRMLVHDKCHKQQFHTYLSFLGVAVTVGVTMFVLSISELSEVGMVRTKITFLCLQL